MPSIDEAFILAAAPNPAAAKNGRGLVIKNKFLTLHHSEDETLLFGQCQGSGKAPYLPSADFSNPASVVYRCTCPSRQFPCKHVLGLLYAYLEGKPFTAAEVPKSIAEKRERASARAQKKKTTAAKPKKVNKAALAKKIKAQLEGLDLLEKLTSDLVHLGIGNTNAKSVKEIEKQAKQLGNAYLPGAQSALHRYTGLFQNLDKSPAAETLDRVQAEALDQLVRLHALVRQGRKYLELRLDDPALAPETESEIAAWLGHAWQIRELKEAGLVQNDVDLLQLSFHQYDDKARREFVETGIWINLSTGQIPQTLNYRPYRAAKYIQAQDSCFELVHVDELCVYPGDTNPRVRWEEHTTRPVEIDDLAKIGAFAQSKFADVVKQVKAQMKNPLADKNPIHLLKFKQIGQVGERLVVEDAHGERLELVDEPSGQHSATLNLLRLLPANLRSNQTLVAKFHHDWITQSLRVHPLSIVTADAIHRLKL